MASLLPFLLPNLHNAQSAKKQHYRNTFTSTLKTWGNEIQQFYFSELCFLNLFYFFLFSYNIENKTRHIHIFPRNCKDDLYRDNVGKPEAQSTDVENSQRSRGLIWVVYNMYCNLTEEMVVLTVWFKRTSQSMRRVQSKNKSNFWMHFMLRMCILCDPQVFVPNILSQ